MTPGPLGVLFLSHHPMDLLYPASNLPTEFKTDSKGVCFRFIYLFVYYKGIYNRLNTDKHALNSEIFLLGV